MILLATSAPQPTLSRQDMQLLVVETNMLGGRYGTDREQDDRFSVKGFCTIVRNDGKQGASARALAARPRSYFERYALEGDSRWPLKRVRGDSFVYTNRVSRRFGGLGSIHTISTPFVSSSFSWRQREVGDPMPKR
jgi:hypothetical protein